MSDAFRAAPIAALIEEKLGYRAETWYESQEAFFQALEQEKVAMFIILVFIVLVAAFNITSTLIMIVMEKRRDIGILRTLGSSSWSILSIFIIEGLLIGLTGTLIGLVLGILLAYNMNPVAEFVAWMLGVDLFNSTIYYFEAYRSPLCRLAVWAPFPRHTYLRFNSVSGVERLAPEPGMHCAMNDANNAVITCRQVRKAHHDGSRELVILTP